jgi:signal transduction histidine kinase
MHDTYNEVIIVLIAGTIVFLVLTGIIVFIFLFYQKKRFKHQRELLQTHTETQEETFTQISEELHDNVGQLLGSTKNLLWITERSLADAPDALRTAIATLATAMHDLRSLSKAFNKEWLERFNLVDNLRVESERLNYTGNLVVTVDSSCKDFPLTREDQVIVFRIIQEALHNAMKHAEASRIGITLALDGHRILIQVRDNGKGFDAGTIQEHGVGLISMKRRTRLLYGTISWASDAADGTMVTISIPGKKIHV